MNNSKNLIQRFCEGKTAPKETLAALELMAIEPKWERFAQEYKLEMERVQVTHVAMKRMDYEMSVQQQYGQYLPIYSLAADDGKNLCDFQCETYILARCGIENSNDALADEARGNYWLQESGVPLYNMGRLMEHNGLYVQRVFDATLEELQVALQANEYAMVVVCNDILEHGEHPDGKPNHAIIVLRIESEADALVAFNPSTGHEEDSYPLSTFLLAWSTSKNYLVTARKAKEHEYNPQPIDVSGVELSPELIQLTETIAENTHDIWAVGRMKEGWTYGPERDDVKKQHPDLLPYYQLPDSEKDYDRETAFGTIRLLVRLGYRIVNVNKLWRCPHCGNPVEPHHSYCSFCGQELEDKDFVSIND